ncbi:MAG: hypothetical protein ACXABY_13980 [Candidatus Thorarchaeota archaeon]|jgi:NTP pyrophosphatase (non-canonical NTP hydrolase)
MNNGQAIELVSEELIWAMGHWPEMKSPHEGWAIIKEELDELWEVVRDNKEGVKTEALRKEATQVAAMATRFLVDLC